MTTRSKSTDPLEIRACNTSDAEVVAMLVAGFRDHLGATSPTDAELAAFSAACLADPRTEFCCAWQDGTPAGYTQSRFFPSLWSAGTEGHLEDLFVLETFRRQSIGGSLLRYAISRASERGVRVFGLNTNDKNERAHQLYRSQGFRPQSHPLWPEGREVRWVKELGNEGA